MPDTDQNPSQISDEIKAHPAINTGFRGATRAYFFQPDPNEDGEPLGLKTKAELDRLYTQNRSLTREEGSWTAFLVERERNGQTEYVSGEDDPQTFMWTWTTDPIKALHLCRREDADKIAGECDDCCIRKHEFIGSAENA